MRAPKSSKIGANNSLNSCPSLEDDGAPSVQLNPPLDDSDCPSFEDDSAPLVQCNPSPDDDDKLTFYEQEPVEGMPCPRLVCDYELVRRQDLKSAKLALNYYNNKHRTKYELVDALSSSVFHYGGFWTHCNFTAKLKSNADEGMDQDSPTKLFFAEMFREDVTACLQLKGKTKAGCVCCFEAIQHPTHGFRQGLYPDRRPITRSLSREYM